MAMRIEVSIEKIGLEISCCEFSDMLNAVNETGSIKQAAETFFYDIVRTES